MKRLSAPAWIMGLLVLLIAAAGLAGPPTERAGSATLADEPLHIARDAFNCRLAGDLDDAVAILNDAVRRYPKSGVLQYELARARLLQLEIEKMQIAADLAAAYDPLVAEYHHFDAMAAVYSLIDAAHHGDDARMNAMGRHMFRELEVALAVDPQHHESRYLLVQQMRDTAPALGIAVADPEDHIAYLEEHDPVLGAKARCLYVDAAQQREIWKQILCDRPGDCRALAEAAEALIDLGDLDEARDCLDKALQKEPDHCYGLLRLSLAYAMDEDYKRAIEVTNRYIATDPPVALKAFATGRLAQIHRRMGDEDRSRELLRAARDLDPNVWLTVMPPPKEIFLSL